MNPGGPCGECGAPLAIDQRYCINCGARVAAPMVMPYVPANPAQAPVASGFWAALPMPIQTAGMCAALALGFGVIVGIALNPNVAGTIAAAPVVVQEAPPPSPTLEPEPVPSGGGGGGGAPDPAPVTVASTGPTGSSSPETGGGGGGSKKKKKPKKEKPTFVSGAVVHLNPVAGSYMLSRGGALMAIHAKKLPAVGTSVRVPIRPLANRTSAEDGKRQHKGMATQATFAGVVTANSDSHDPAISDTYTVSGRGSSVLVHSPPDPSPTGDAVPPAVGAVVSVTVGITDPAPPPATLPAPASTQFCGRDVTPLPAPAIVPAKELVQTAITVDPAAATAAELETVVQWICTDTSSPDNGKVLVSSDDIRVAGTDIALALDPAAAIDVSQLTTGQPVIGSIAIEDLSGVKTVTMLKGIAGDLGIKGADDTSTAQGDLK